MTFPIEEYKKMLYTRHSAAQLGLSSLEPWNEQNAARLMSIVQVFGNNEGFTLSPKFNVDREYIQDIYNINGGGVPSNGLFRDWLINWVAKYEAVNDKTDPIFVEANEWIKSMYNFNLYC